MKITDISVQVRNSNRVNISVDGVYRLSLDLYQIGELNIKNGMEVSPDDLAKWGEESEFGKLYGRALEYCLMRPHSAKEVRDYLTRKTFTRRIMKRKPRSAASNKFAKGDGDVGPKTSYGTVIEKPGVSRENADRVYQRLIDRGYIDDEKFAQYWVENRNLSKGFSRKKLVMELHAKGIASDVIDKALEGTDRNDKNELQKIIAKKRQRYPDITKLQQYLLRQGFPYDDIKQALSDIDDYS